MKIDFDSDQLILTPECDAEKFQLEWLSKQMSERGMAVAEHRQWIIQSLTIWPQKGTKTYNSGPKLQ